MDAMIDIETLSKKNNAVVLSLGLVIFDPQDYSELGSGDPAFIASHYWELKVVPQVMKGRHICPETVRWWDDQPIAAPDGFFPIEKCLAELADVFEAHKIENVWFRGPQFDEVKLQSLGEDFGIEMPWKYNAVRCCRTLCKLAKRDRSADTFKLHHAGEDCRSQALDVQHTYKELGWKQSPQPAPSPVAPLPAL